MEGLLWLVFVRVWWLWCFPLLQEKKNEARKKRVSFVLPLLVVLLKVVSFVLQGALVHVQRPLWEIATVKSFFLFSFLDLYVSQSSLNQSDIANSPEVDNVAF